jgi:hypothetical protein
VNSKKASWSGQHRPETHSRELSFFLSIPFGPQLELSAELVTTGWGQPDEIEPRLFRSGKGPLSVQEEAGDNAFWVRHATTRWQL